MKILRAILLFVLLIPASAQITVIVTNPYRFAAAGGVSYLINQNFEGTGYDNSETWTEAGGSTPDEDYTGVVLQGSQSLRVNVSAATGSAISPNFAVQSDCWVYCNIRVVSYPGTTVGILTIQSTGASEAVRVAMDNGGHLVVRAGGGTAGTSVSAVALNTLTHIWVHYTKGGGANAIGTVGFSTDGTKPTAGNAYTECTNGTATIDAGRINVGATSSSTYEIIYDKVRVDDAVIGDNPT